MCSGGAPGCSGSVCPGSAAGRRRDVAVACARAAHRGAVAVRYPATYVVGVRAVAVNACNATMLARARRRQRKHIDGKDSIECNNNINN